MNIFNDRIIANKLEYGISKEADKVFKEQKNIIISYTNIYLKVARKVLANISYTPNSQNTKENINCNTWPPETIC